jgi:hypothetical protein
MLRQFLERNDRAIDLVLLEPRPGFGVVARGDGREREISNGG